MWKLTRVVNTSMRTCFSVTCANLCSSINVTSATTTSSSSESRPTLQIEELGAIDKDNAVGVYGKNFTISKRTWERIAEKNCSDGVSNSERFLRLAIDSGGCHGFVYKFTFEPLSAFDPTEDILIKASDVNADNNEEDSTSNVASLLVVDKLSADKMENATIDYHSELKGAAFVVIGNELIDQSCACAMSFSLKSKGKRKLYQQPTQQHSSSSSSSSTSSKLNKNIVNNSSSNSFSSDDNSIKNDNNNSNNNVSSPSTTTLPKSRGTPIQRKRQEQEFEQKELFSEKRKKV